MKNTLRGLSLFSSAGIAEMNLKKCNIDILVSNELLAIRSKVHEFWHKNCETITGDITNENIKKNIIEKCKEKKINFIIATPPCQGVSLIGKNKSNDQMLSDSRNFLIFHAIDIIKEIDPEIIIIENVPRYLKMFFPFNGKMQNIVDILTSIFFNKYKVIANIYNSADYGVPQNRQRAIIILHKDNYYFCEPKKQKIITVEEAIGHLPSLESGERSNIKNHNARKHIDSHIMCMKHTPTGHSAFENKIYYPKNKDGKKSSGYMATYKRIDWDKPAPTITMRNDAISSQSNVHPGRKNKDGTYSDARVLTLRELFILSSINPDIDVPNFASDTQIRQMIGESVPPKLIEIICKNIFKKEDK